MEPVGKHSNNQLARSRLGQETLNPKTQTLNPKPQTLNPKP